AARRPPERRPAGAWLRVTVVRSVMPPSMPGSLSRYQEPTYPGTRSTWHRPALPGMMGVMTAMTTNGNGSRRAELAAFLRSRRERISPEQVGLPPGLRRRTPGLRREEVAQLAGVGVTWYTWLEQGRPINASAQVLDAVARVLHLDAAGRWHLYWLAEAMPVRSQADPYGVPGSASQVLR